uniref:Uncharacterized protein n=1 Tax=Myotis myotis TaxID=51298 RepID=A0A7J8AMZ9_MYOMY|nr:hypothetical protein mMyoMyo1_008196 [Myotis myotis]
MPAAWGGGVVWGVGVRREWKTLPVPRGGKSSCACAAFPSVDRWVWVGCFLVKSLMANGGITHTSSHRCQNSNSCFLCNVWVGTFPQSRPMKPLIPEKVCALPTPPLENNLFEAIERECVQLELLLLVAWFGIKGGSRGTGPCPLPLGIPRCPDGHASPFNRGARPFLPLKVAGVSKAAVFPHQIF